MKTTHSFLKRTCLFLALFSWLLPMNLSADPIAIGTGTVTLNCDNVTYHNGIDVWVNPGGTTTSWSSASTPGACCLYVYGGNTSGTDLAYWDVTIQSGNYDVEMHYGTMMYGITAKFDVIDPSNGTELALLYDQGYQGAPVNLTRSDNFNLTADGAKTYRVQAMNMYNGGGSHFVVEYIKFTRTDGCVTPDVATFAKGDAESGSVSNIEMCAGSEFSMPNQGSMSYPGYLFTGWKLNNAGVLIAAGTSYTMPAGGASFTAQWEVDSESLQIPSACTVLDADNYSDLFGYKNDQSRDIDQDGNPDNHLNIWGGDAQWKVCITPGSYSITTTCCVFSYGLHARVTLIDPAGIESTIVIYDSGNQSGSYNVYKSGTHTDIVDLSGITAYKQYIVKAEDFWDGVSRGGCQLMLKDIVFTPLGANQNITFAKGDEAVTGILPANTTCAGEGSYTLPAKGDLAWSGHMFTGWSDGSNTYAAGASYTMPNHDVTFTAQWDVAVVPAVSNLAITNPVNSTIPLSWAIPGICDLSKPVEPLSQNIKNENGLSTVTSLTYNPSENSVTAIGNSKGYCQYGVAFDIPQVNNIESITIDCKENEDPSVKGITLWGGVIERDNGVYDSDAGKTLYPTYWQYSSDLHNYRPTDWEKRSFTMDLGYWDSPSYVKADKYIQQIAVFANTWNGGDGVTGVSFSVREVRYHIDGQIDVDHVVLMRKEGSAATGIDDAGATQLYSGPNSQFTDEEAKTPGTTYYYTVFAIDADDNVSAAVSTSHTIETVATCTVSYDANGGSGTAPTDDDEYAAGGTITMPNANALSKPFSSVSGWKKGNAGDLIPIGETYTVTAADVEAGSISFYAQWVEDATTIRIPTVTVLNYGNQSTSVPTTNSYDVTDDGINDVCLDMSNRTAEWNVFITPGIYDISTICAVPYWGIGYTLSIVDPQTDSQVMELFTEHTSGAGGVPIIRNLTHTFDLSSLIDGKRYIIRVQDTWTGCSLLVHDIIFSPQTPSLTTHTRNLPVGEYGTICLPYEVQAANIAGADVFELAGWPAESNAVTLNQIAGNMAAGHPYIFQATAATSTFSYEESGYQDAQSVNGLIGSYTQETITPNDNNFIIYNNQLYLVDVLAYVGANRAYINRTAAESAVASPAPGRRQIKLYVAGTEVATGLEQINGTCPDGKFIQDGQLFIRRDGRTYNAQGAMMK